LARRALRSIVLNGDELRLSEDPEASVALVPDGVPRFEQVKEGESAGDPFTVVVVCGGWRNEPVEEILDACRLLPEVRFLLTGDADELPEAVRARAGANVEFTGYLRGEEYEECLRSSDVGMVLSLRNDLSAGAFECLGMGLPMILSDWPNPREHFEEAAVFVACDAEAIARGVSRVEADYPAMRRNVDAVRSRRTEDWQVHFRPVRTAVEQKARGDS
jgi:glycosyltransferase involved in cell wall biosynthesis